MTGILLAFAAGGCVQQKGLVTDDYDPAFYRAAKRLPSDTLVANPTFVVYGDQQGGWRVRHNFLAEKNWRTWKQLLFPFYQLYLLGEGAVGGLNWERQMPDYGEGERRAVRDALLGETERTDLDFILSTGDIASADGRRPEHWEAFLDINQKERALLGRVPYLPTPGNHDRTTDVEFGLPNYEAVFGRKPFYVVDFPDGALFVLDSNLLIDWKQEVDDAEQERLFQKWFVSGDPAEPAWLEQALAERSEKPFTFVSMHHPPVSFGNRAGQWGNPRYGPDVEAKRWKLLDLFQKCGVTAVFSGHEHLYEHNVLRYERQGVPAQMHFVISSGGGGPLRKHPPEEKTQAQAEAYRTAGLDVRHERQERRYHYALVDVNAERVRIEVKAVEDDGETGSDDAQDVRLLDEIVIARPAPHANAGGK